MGGCGGEWGGSGKFELGRLRGEKRKGKEG